MPKYQSPEPPLSGDPCISVEASENHFRSLADAMPQIVWEANSQGLLTYTNRRWTDYSGSDEPERWLEFVHPDDRPQVVEVWTACVASGQSYEAQFRLLRQADQQYRWHLVRAEMFKDCDSSICRWYGTCTDVTEQIALQDQKSAAIAALRQAEGQLSQALRTSRVGFWSLDFATNKLSLSEQMIVDWGIDLASFDGTLESALARIHPQDRAETEAAIARSLAEDVPYVVSYRIFRPSGETVWIEARGETSRDENGQLLRFSGTSVDISERIETQKRIEASAAEFRALAELAPQMLFTSDPRGNINYYNEPLFEYTGMSFDELKDWGWRPIVHPDFYQRTVQRWTHSLISGELYECEFPVRRHDGVFRWHLARAIPVRDECNEIIKWMGTLTDIDEQKRIVCEFEQAKEAAEEANLAKSVFLANMSHEIRTPLGAIMGFAELLRQADQSDDDRSDCITTIIRNGDHLLNLINDILDLSKVESGKLELETERISLPGFMNELQLLLRQKATEKGLGFIFAPEGPVPATILTDSMRLKQILLNVIGNAIKFTDKGRVSVGAQLQAGTTRSGSRILEIRVEDSGCGLSLEQIGRLFEPFVQADSTTTRRFGGTGLGLALSRKLARVMGGDLQLLCSEKDKGSTFVLTLPVGEIAGVDMVNSFRVDAKLPSPARQRSGENNAQVLSGLRILVVEDTLDNQKLIARFLRGAGAELKLASNGAEGLEMGLAEPFDLILMDIQMPVLDGLQATRHLRSEGFTGPILALTAHAMKEERDRCLQAGCNDTLTKPIDRTQLIETVARYGQTAVELEVSDEFDNLIADILEVFLRETFPNILAQIAAAIESNDVKTVAHHAHTLMGSVAVYKYRSLGGLAKELEREAKGAARREAMLARLGDLKLLYEWVTS